MGGMTQLSDEFLLAYLDGQLEKGQAAEVTQLASANVEISRRLMRLKRTQTQILETFGSFAREEIALPRSVFQFDESDGKQALNSNAGFHPGAAPADRKAPSTAKRV